jgi:ComF family protein
VCVHCQAFQPHFTAIRSWAVFDGPIRQAIHRLKYIRDISLGVILAEPLVDLYLILKWECDLIIPVPLGLARLKERGYNQSDLLARPLSLAVGIPYQSDGLKRVRETRSQVGLTFTQRIDNVSGAFQALSKSVSGQRVLVVDDVATSSATLDACASALIEAGSKEVFALTLTRAGSQNIN